MDNIILQNDALRVAISPVGAEIQSIRDSEGVERIWDGGPAFWTGRAPVLFPVAGAFIDDRYTLDGRPFTLEKHGFAKRRVFAVEAQEDTAAAFLLVGRPDEEAGFPFAYTLRVAFSLDGQSLGVTYTVENRGDTRFYYNTGAHEAYACPEGIDAYEIVFDEDEPLTISVLGGGGLTRQTEVLPSQGGVLPLSYELYTARNTLVFPSLRSRGVTLRSRLHSRTVRVDYPDYDYLLLWTMICAPYLCIEPWGNLPDYADTDHDIAHKTGMIPLAPGETRTQAHTIHFG